MNDADKKQFSEAFVYLCEVFDKKSSKMLLKAYFDALKAHPIQAVQDAIGKAITGCKFFPKPVELIEFISGGPQSLADLALKEATRSLDAIKKLGRYKSVIFDDSVTQAVIVKTFGGWVKMCSELTTETEKWFIKDFCASYQAFSRQNITHDGILSGAAEIDNSANGNNHDENTIAIGNIAIPKRITTNVNKLTEGIG